VKYPAGWYPGPDGQQMYWDGEQWVIGFGAGAVPEPVERQHQPSQGERGWATPAPPPLSAFGGPALGTMAGAYAPVASQSVGFSVGAIIMGCISLLFFPIVFGPIGIGLAVAAVKRRERYAVVGMCVAAGGAALGMAFGILAFMLIRSR
jgi:hypothetical protein